MNKFFGYLLGRIMVAALVTFGTGMIAGWILGILGLQELLFPICVIAFIIGFIINPNKFFNQ